MTNNPRMAVLLIAPFLVLSLLLTLPVYADQTFHTARLSLVLTSAGSAAGHPNLRSGHVVDIHTNGPSYTPSNATS